MTAHDAVLELLVAGAWQTVAASSTGCILRRPDTERGAVRYAYLGARGRIELRRGDGVSVVRSIARSTPDAAALTLTRKALEFGRDR